MTFQEQLEIALPLGVAALGGLAVGIEREWSARAAGEGPRFAGVRTFLLIGLLGAMSVQLMHLESVVAGAAILAAGALLIVVAYVRSILRGGIDSTTEFAAVLVLASGALAGAGKLAMASAINAFTALILVEKSRIHSLVFRIRSEELVAGARFAVLALVILPLLPEGPYGPLPGLRPRDLWALVLLFSGLSFAGFIARRAVGAEKGYPVAGLLGGLVSSTLVTLNFSRESRSHPELGQSLGVGVLAACTVLFVRAAILTFLLNQRMALAALPYLTIPFFAGLLVLGFEGRRNAGQATTLEAPKNPLSLLTAIQMVIAFQAALYIMRWVIGQFGSTGVLVTAGFLGFTDVDTLIFTMSKQSELAPYFGAQALAVGIIANTLLKLVIALVIGRGRFRRIASLGLIAILVFGVTALFLTRL